MSRTKGALTAVAALITAAAAQAQMIDTNGLQQVTLDQVGGATTYWLVKGPCPSPDGSPPPPYPFIPPDIADLNLPMYFLTSDQVLVDDSSVCYEAIETMNRLIIQASDDGPPPPPGPGGGTNGYGGGVALIAPTTNDLWLEITGTSNAGTPNGTASLIVHTPWNITNNVYDLFYATNLESPKWKWLLRTDPFGTNLTAIATDPTNSNYKLGLSDLAANSSLGTNFWLAFPDLGVQDNLYLALYISSPVGATGTVTIPRLQITNYFSVAAAGLTNIPIDTNIMVTLDDNDMVKSDGIHVTASQPVSVYALHYALYIAAAFTCYPTSLLGANYCIMARPGNRNANQDTATGYVGEIAIVATEDNTTVWITPSPTANFVGRDGTPYAITLTNQGQSYVITTHDYDSDPWGLEDPTGTFITSDRPVAVFAGTKEANVPYYYYCCANPLMQEQLPIEYWGKQALAISFADRLNGDSYRVLSVNPDTVVLTNGSFAGSLTNGEFMDLIIDGPVEFEANQPIQVAQFANSKGFDNGPNTFQGDPSEILLLPTGHYLTTNIVFALPYYGNQGDIQTNYLNIIVAQSAISTTLIDGSSVDATNFIPIGTSGFYGARRKSLPEGKHIITSSQPVGVQVYGLGIVNAYGYFGGVVR